MGWSEEEKKRLGEKLWEMVNQSGPDSIWEQAVMLADLTVEFVRARGGTMTAEDLARLPHLLACGSPDGAEFGRRVIGHIAAQGARVAELEAERDSLKLRFDLALSREADGRAELAKVKQQADAAQFQMTEKVRDLTGELARLRPSGQVAEDEAMLLALGDDGAVPDGWTGPEWRNAVRSLAAGAQEAEALRARVKELEEELKQWKRGSEVSFHETEGLKRERDAARAEVEALRKKNEEMQLGASLLESAVRSTLAREARLTDAAIRACAELRHAYRPEARDWNLVAGAIRILETATTPKEPPRCTCPTPAGSAHEAGCPGARYPCSSTCTHDDAAKPGHPQRVKERSAMVVDAISAGKAVVHESFDQGAEAMRVACLEAALVWAQSEGLSLSMQADLKTAIEGATP